MLTPKKTASTSSTTVDRGVEVKQLEFNNGQSDTSMSNLAQFHIESSSAGSMRDNAANEGGLETSSQNSSAPFTDETASYIQVVVQKHHRKREQPAIAAVQTSPRLPVASSPITKEVLQKAPECSGDAQPPPPQQAPSAGYVPGYVLQQPMLFTYPSAPPQQYPWPTATPVAPTRATAEVASSARSSSSFKKTVKVVRGKPAVKYSDAGDAENCETKGAGSTSVWKKFIRIANNKMSPKGDGPERLELYYFDRCEGSSVCTGPEPGALGRWVERTDRGTQRLMVELLTLATFVASLPITLFVLTLRSACILFRRLVTGVLGTVTEHAVRPTVAAVFNLGLAPVMLFLHHVIRGGGEMLRPVFGFFNAVVESVVKIVAAVRPVHIER